MSPLGIKYFDYLFSNNSQNKSHQLRESEIRAMMFILNETVSIVKTEEKKCKTSDKHRAIRYDSGEV